MKTLWRVLSMMLVIPMAQCAESRADRDSAYIAKLEVENGILRQELGRLYSEISVLQKTIAQLQAAHPGKEPAPSDTRIIRPQDQWREVVRFNGVGNKNTAPFEITGSHWRIKWTFVANGAALFIVSTPGPEKMILASTLAPGSETSYGRGRGIFSLDVTAVGTSWMIIVEEMR